MVYDRRTIGMRELALFAGAGGGILGGKMLGWRTVCAVEIEEYPRRVLLQRQRDGILDKFPIWDDVRTFDGSPWRGKVDVISGGFPCQDISAAGKGAGIENGERSGLWREYARIVRTIRPEYVFVENSPMLTVRGLGTVLGDLASLGYDAKWKVLSAEDCGAPHERERIWIVARSRERERERWPTPIRNDFRCDRSPGQGRRHSPTLAYLAAKYPTPRTHGMCGGTGAWEQMRKMVDAGIMTDEERHSIGAGNGGKLNPDWVEWLMGWIVGWTDLRPLATDKYQSWLRGRF